MVWSFAYEPAGSSYPDAQLADGPGGSLVLEDPSRDGGTGFVGGTQSYSGRRVKPESVPRAIRFMSDRPLQDFESQFVKTVSDRLRAVIEDLEPGVHQFEPIQYVARDGMLLETRWFWQICNRLDSVHRDKTTWVLDEIMWRIPVAWDKKSYLVFDLSKIGAAKFWNDKHVHDADYCSDDARDRLDSEGVTGLRYSYREQA